MDRSEQVDIKCILKSKSEKKQVGLKREKILYNSKEKDNYAYIDEIKESETRRNIVSDITKDYSTGNCANDDYIKSGNVKNQELPEKKKPVIEISEPLIRPFDFNDLKVTGCVFDTYITATDANSFYMIDQHAAQERIFYEQLVEEYLSDDKPSQSILTPIVIDVALEVKEEEYSWLDSLGDMGYLLEEFGPNSYIIKEIPYFMDITEAENFAKDYIEQTHSGIKINNKVVIDKLITRSCKSAIKAHDKLSQEAMESLINELKYCRNPFSCPHGRPTFIKFSNYDIEKMFKRV